MAARVSDLECGCAARRAHCPRHDFRPRARVQGGKSEEEAHKFIAEMATRGRLIQELWS